MLLTSSTSHSNFIFNSSLQAVDLSVDLSAASAAEEEY
jgi:hypothetical protein